jgi:hypothetical protein
MTEQEWGPIAALIDNSWKDHFDRIRAAAYYTSLQHWPASIVREAVVRLAGARAHTIPPVSAAGAYSPSAETIARECEAINFVGTWPWAMYALELWLRPILAEHVRTTSHWRLRDDELTDDMRNQLLDMHPEHPEHGARLLALVESFGVEILCAARNSAWFKRQARLRWARLLNGQPLTELTR